MVSKNSGGNSAILKSLGPHVSEKQKIMGPLCSVIVSRVRANPEIMGLYFVNAI